MQFHSDCFLVVQYSSEQVPENWLQKSASHVMNIYLVSCCMLSRLMVISRLSSDALLRITDLSSDALQNFVSYSCACFPCSLSSFLLLYLMLCVSLAYLLWSFVPCDVSRSRILRPFIHFLVMVALSEPHATEASPWWNWRIEFGIEFIFADI